MRRNVVWLSVLALILMLVVVFVFVAYQRYASALPGKIEETTAAQTGVEEIAASGEAITPSDALDDPAQMTQSTEATAPSMTFPEDDGSDAGTQNGNTEDTEADAPAETEAEDETHQNNNGSDENELPTVPF